MSDYKQYVLSNSEYQEIDQGNFRTFKEALEALKTRVDKQDGVFYVFEFETNKEIKIVMIDGEIYCKLGENLNEEEQ